MIKPKELHLPIPESDQRDLAWFFRHADGARAEVSLRSGSAVDPSGGGGRAVSRTGDAAENAIIRALGNAGRFVRVRECLRSLSKRQADALDAFFGRGVYPSTWAGERALCDACDGYHASREALDEHSLEAEAA